jgi:hypothetical protein
LLCLPQPLTAATITVEPATAQGGDCDLRRRYRSVPHQDHWIAKAIIISDKPLILFVGNLSVFC